MKVPAVEVSIVVVQSKDGMSQSGEENVVAHAVAGSTFVVLTVYDLDGQHKL